MDGFEGTTGVIVIAATNRPDVLDPALVRPGRFDRQVVDPLPDIRGREQILLVHMRKVPVAPDVKAEIIARGTPGFSGADLANLVNEAALFAARKNKRLVDMDDFERAKDKIVMGAERRSMVMPEEERRNTAFHESGHAMVAKLLPKTDPVHTVTIIPRGRALGVTMQLPEQDRYSMDRERLLSTIAVLFGGRIAEEVFMHQMTTGASNDFERATAIARSMVTQWGMSDLMGPMVYGENDGEVFLGRSITTHKNVSEVTMQKVDAEIRKIIDQQYTLAKKLILDNRDKVEAMAKALLELETIDAEQINDIMAGKPPRPPKPAQAPQQPPQAAAPGAAGGTRRRLVEGGADVFDVGADSSRRGADAVATGEDMRRLLPVLKGLRDLPVPLSVDTVKPEVMRAAIAEGASMINDINALRAPGALETAADADVGVCLMHMQGEPRTMQREPRYRDVVAEVKAFLAERVAAAEARGIARERIVIDPGFGFGKTVAHNFELLRNLDRFAEMGLPVMAGWSRKSTLGAITGRGAGELLAASIAAALLAVQHGATIVRVHDVAATRDAFAVLAAIDGHGSRGKQ